VEVLHLGNLNRDNATEYMLHKAQQLGLSSPEDAQERADLMEQIFGVSHRSDHQARVSAGACMACQGTKT
jgi:hypothetical protein